MYITEMAFELNKDADSSDVEQAISLLLGALRMNGQILGRELPVCFDGKAYFAFLLIPAVDSLDNLFANEYVKNCFNKLDDLGVIYSSTVKGRELDAIKECNCSNINSYILFTDYISLESPVRCGDCFGTVPLYKINQTADGEYHDIISWQSDYKACDTLQMNCSTGERFAYNQMLNHDSSLSKRGIDICNRISSKCEKPVYYYLYKYSGRSKNDELKRKCPSCGGEWLLNEPLHNLFDFCCYKCNLLSNIAMSVK